MKKMKRLIVLFVVMIVMAFSVTACGDKPVTEKELDKAQEKLEKGKITQNEFWEIYDAYLNGEPMPDNGGEFFATVGELIVICVVIGGVVVVVKKYKNKK